MFSFQVERTDEEVEDLMFELIKKRHHLIHKNFSVSKYERPDRVPDIPPMPVELFRRDSIEQRRNLFFKGLNRGDVLYLQVVNSLADSYKLWILAKQKECMKIDDLGLVMYLPKLWPEMKLLGSELNKGDFIKAALCSCSLHERKLYVTLDETLLTVLGEEVEMVKLGIITYQDLPYYVGSFKNGLSYVGYIHRSEAFYNPAWSNQMSDVLGLKKNHIYSFFEGWEGKTYPPHEYASELKQKQLLMQSNKYYNKAVVSYDEGRIDETFTFLNKALDSNPDNVQALTTRGTVHANVNSLRKAFIDTEAALRLDPGFQPAKKQMSKLLIALARTHLEQGNYIKANESLKMSSALDGDNVELTKSLQDLIPTRVRNLNNQTDDSSLFRVPMRSLSSSREKRMGSDVTMQSKKKEKKHHRKRSRHHHSHRHHHRRNNSRSQSPRKISSDSTGLRTFGPPQ